MEMLIRDQYEQYVESICKIESIRKNMMEFYDDFCAHFEGKEFTKEHFETARINGKDVEQDIVIEMFKKGLKKRKSASAGEVLTYILKKNIKEVKAITSSEENVGGCVNVNDCTIEIKIPRAREENEPEVDRSRWRGFLNDETYGDYYNTAEEADAKLKEYVYHEMSHITQLRTFHKRRFAKIELSHLTLMKSRFGDISLCTNEINNKDVKIALKNKKEGVKSMVDAEALIEAGHKAISEYLNQEFALKLGNQFEVVEEQYDLGYVYARKVQNVGDVKYYDNYDIGQLIKLAIGDIDERDLRFNTSEYFKRINNLNVSEETINNAKIQLKNNETFRGFEREIDKFSLSDIIAYSVGLNEPSIQWMGSFEDKLIAENILIEGIKNNIISELEDDKIVKDDKFIKKLDLTLTTIDSVLAYPIISIEVDTIENLAKKTDLPHILNFADLCSKVKSAKLFTSIDAEIVDKMTFFKQQAKIQREYIEKHKENQNIHNAERTENDNQLQLNGKGDLSDANADENLDVENIMPEIDPIDL